MGGMLAPLGKLGAKWVALAIDAKQKVARNQYCIATVGMLTKSQSPRATDAKRTGHAQVQIRAQTSTFWPLAQALMDATTWPLRWKSCAQLLLLSVVR